MSTLAVPRNQAIQKLREKARYNYWIIYDVYRYPSKKSDASLIMYYDERTKKVYVGVYLAGMNIVVKKEKARSVESALQIFKQRKQMMRQGGDNI